MELITRDGKLIDYRNSLPDNLMPSDCCLGHGYPKGRNAGRGARLV